MSRFDIIDGELSLKYKRKNVNSNIFPVKTISTLKVNNISDMLLSKELIFCGQN